MPSDQNDPELRLSPDDIDRAVLDGVIAREDADRLLKWGYNDRYESQPVERERPVEQARGFNLVTVAYYFGAMLMISACAWFLGDKWDALGSAGILTTTLIYALIATTIGLWLRGKGYFVGGGLLVTIAVCLVPLIVYAIEDLLNLWPGDRPGNYEDYYPWINGSWIVMELATILVALVALRYVPFGFLTAPLAFSFWFFSMDVAALILGRATLHSEESKWITVTVGLITLLIGFGLDRYFARTRAPATEDFAFWCYFFGMLAFWGGLTSMDSDSEISKMGYAFLNLCLIGIAIKLRRTVFLVFGVLGVHIYLGHLAYRVFEDSFFFPFAIAFLGLSLILVTVFVQQRVLKRDES